MLQLLMTTRAIIRNKASSLVLRVEGIGSYCGRLLFVMTT
jgi:hypothetical protein